MIERTRATDLAGLEPRLRVQTQLCEIIVQLTGFSQQHACTVFEGVGSRPAGPSWKGVVSSTAVT